MDILIDKIPKLAGLVQQVINEETDHLGQQLFNTQTQLLAAQQENSNLGSQLFDLQTQLIMKGVV